MSEIGRIARLLEQSFEGKPYYGPSVLAALADVTADVATRKLPGRTHSIWEIVAHLTAELIYARAITAGTAGPWIGGKTTWPPITDTSNAPWQQALRDLQKAKRSLVREVKRLDDSILDKEAHRVHVSFYLMLHGTIQHNVYHAGQISLLAGKSHVPTDGASGRIDRWPNSTTRTLAAVGESVSGQRSGTFLKGAPCAVDARRHHVAAEDCRHEIIKRVATVQPFQRQEQVCWSTARWSKIGRRGLSDGVFL